MGLYSKGMHGGVQNNPQLPLNKHGVIQVVEPYIYSLGECVRMAGLNGRMLVCSKQCLTPAPWCLILTKGFALVAGIRLDSQFYLTLGGYTAHTRMVRNFPPTLIATLVTGRTIGSVGCVWICQAAVIAARHSGTTAPNAKPDPFPIRTQSHSGQLFVYGVSQPLQRSKMRQSNVFLTFCTTSPTGFCYVGSNPSDGSCDIATDLWVKSVRLFHTPTRTTSRGYLMLLIWPPPRAAKPPRVGLLRQHASCHSGIRKSFWGNFWTNEFGIFCCVCDQNHCISKLNSPF